jgi:hypothetical protein
MSNFGQTEEDDGRQQQEDAEYCAWLDEREKEMIENLDWNMKQMWKQFETIFNKPESK